MGSVSYCGWRFGGFLGFDSRLKWGCWSNMAAGQTLDCYRMETQLVDKLLDPKLTETPVGKKKLLQNIFQKKVLNLFTGVPLMQDTALLHRLHYSKCKLHTIFPNVSLLCDKPQFLDSNLSHSYVMCVKLQSFWNQIFQVFSDTLKIHIKPDPIWMIYSFILVKKKKKGSSNSYIMADRDLGYSSLWQN